MTLDELLDNPTEQKWLKEYYDWNRDAPSYLKNKNNLMELADFRALILLHKGTPVEDNRSENEKAHDRLDAEKHIRSLVNF